MTRAIYLRVTRSKPERGTGRVARGSWGQGGQEQGFALALMGKLRGQRPPGSAHSIARTRIRSWGGMDGAPAWGAPPLGAAKEKGLQPAALRNCHQSKQKVYSK